MKFVLPRAVQGDEKSFSLRLEERVWKTLIDRQSASRSPALRALENEMALTLDQLSIARELHARIQRELEEVAEYVQAEIVRWTPRPGLYPDPFRELREPLRDRWLKLRTEHRRVSVAALSDLRPLQDRLLALLARHRQLAAIYDNRNPRQKA